MHGHPQKNIVAGSLGQAHINAPIRKKGPLHVEKDPHKKRKCSPPYMTKKDPLKEKKGPHMDYILFPGGGGGWTPTLVHINCAHD